MNSSKQVSMESEREARSQPLCMYYFYLKFIRTSTVTISNSANAMRLSTEEPIQYVGGVTSVTTELADDNSLFCGF